MNVVPGSEVLLAATLVMSDLNCTPVMAMLLGAVKVNVVVSMVWDCVSPTNISWFGLMVMLFLSV